MNVGKTKPTIDLISIGIVSDDGREYYAISKDFNLKEAWNRFQIEERTPFEKYNGFSGRKNYWIRDNVLKPIFREWYAVHNNVDPTVFDHKFTYKEFKRLLNKYGKTNKQIAEEIEMFTTRYVLNEHAEHPMQNSIKVDEIEFYAYYGAFDYVLFSQLFGSFSNYPNRFPMYFKDLKQEVDRKMSIMAKYEMSCPKDTLDSLKSNGTPFAESGKIDWKKWLKEHPNYPKQTNEHNALADARWNYELYKFLNKTLIMATNQL